MWSAASNERRGLRRWKNSSNSSGCDVGKGLAVRESGGRRPSRKCIFLLRCLLVGLLAGDIGRGVSADWIDLDTPQSAYNTTSIPLGNTDKKNFKLVMSDEFNAPGRSFGDGDDPTWTTMHKNDYTNAALQFYSKDRVTTEDGFLKISTTNEDVNVPYWNDESRSVKYQKKTYVSGYDGRDEFLFLHSIVLKIVLLVYSVMLFCVCIALLSLYCAMGRRGVMACMLFNFFLPFYTATSIIIPNVKCQYDTRVE